MKLIVVILAIGLSTYMGYLQYNNYRKIAIDTDFLNKFSRELVSNNTHKMLPLHVLLSQEYSAFFNENIEFESCESALEFIESTFCNFEGASEYLTKLKRFISSYGDELNDNAAELLEIAKQNNDKYKESLNKNGKTAFALFPAISIMALIMII